MLSSWEPDTLLHPYQPLLFYILAVSLKQRNPLFVVCLWYKFAYYCNHSRATRSLSKTSTSPLTPITETHGYLQKASVPLFCSDKTGWLLFTLKKTGVKYDQGLNVLLSVSLCRLWYSFQLHRSQKPSFPLMHIADLLTSIIQLSLLILYRVTRRRIISRY